MITISLNGFINNKVYDGVVHIRYYILADDLTITKNAFIDNSAAYDVFINSECKPGYSSSYGSPRCIKCPSNWLKNFVLIIMASLVGGIVLVILMLALNMTVAVGTFNGILLYVHIVATNADTYFFPFLTPNVVTVFISWLNLDIGVDICLFEGMDPTIKAIAQLFFPSYVNTLILIVIAASECSVKFAKIIGKGNPVAVLATMSLISYAKFFNTILESIYLLYFSPAYGSSNADVALISRHVQELDRQTGLSLFYRYNLLLFSLLTFFVGISYAALVTFWQWFMPYQDRLTFRKCFVRKQDNVICKWVRYQKICEKLSHFIEPFHAPYTRKHRYWTGLLIFSRVIVSLFSALKFLFDPQIPVELLTTILVIGGLLFVKGVTSKRVYKNWLLDVLETFIYFNLLAFSALTWYNLTSQAFKNQIAVAYTSVMIIFILLLGVIVFHILRYTRLYKVSFVEKAFKWISSNLVEKKRKQEPPNDAPEELDGYQFERPNLMTKNYQL